MSTGALTAGVATADITPPVGVAMAGYGSREQVASGIADPLQAQALVLEAGDTACAVVCTDLIGLEADIVADIRQRAQALSGIPGEQIMLCGSHTHWGPLLQRSRYIPGHLQDTVSEDYLHTLNATLAGLVAQAHRERQPAAAGWGTGWAETITFNRRTVGDDGLTQMNLMLDPPQALAASREGNRLARAWRRGQHLGPRLSAPLTELGGLRVGPADAEVALLRLDRTDGTPLAGLLSFACHAVCGGGDFYHFSADYPGQARQAFTALTGSPLLFAAGSAGDQVPRWRGEGSRRRVGRSLGAAAAAVWLGIDELHGRAPLQVARQEVRFPLNEKVPSQAEAEAALAAHEDPEGTAACMLRAMAGLARELEQYPEGYPGEVWALRLGEVGLVALPGEVLVEIGQQIKQRSPFPVTIVVSLANGCPGYMPTDNACREGGYEPGWSPVGRGTERVLVDTSLALLQSLQG